MQYTEPLKYKELFSSAYPQDLEEIVEMLGYFQIDYITEAQGSTFNPNLAFSREPNAVVLLVREDQFEQAKGILVDAGYLANVSEEDGYREMLGGLPDDDLEEMVLNPRMYPKEQVAMARKMLLERGIQLEEPEIIQEREAIAQKERESKDMVFMGKIIWGILSFVMPPVGIAISIAVLFFRARDITGKRYYHYNRTTRILGIVLLGISGFLMLFWVWANFLTSYLWYF